MNPAKAKVVMPKLGGSEPWRQGGMDRSRQPHLGKKEEHQWVSDSLVISPSVPLSHTSEMGTNQVRIIGIMAAPARPGFFSVDGQDIVDNGHQGAPSQPRHGQMCPGQVASAFYLKFWPSFFINFTDNNPGIYSVEYFETHSFGHSLYFQLYPAVRMPKEDNPWWLLYCWFT